MTGALVTPMSAIKGLLRNSRQHSYAMKESPEAGAKTAKAGGAQKPRTAKPKTTIQWKKVTPRQVMRLVHRFAILCAAVIYIIMSLHAAYNAISLLDGKVSAYNSKDMGTSMALGQHIGTTTMRESAFVTRVLQNDTRPRNATIYYDMETFSFDVCDAVAPKVRTLYSTAFLQSIYAAVSRGTAYKLAFLSEDASELIVPLVDCTNPFVLIGDLTMMTLNFLVRSKRNADDVYILSFTLLNQMYEIAQRKRQGPAAVGTLTFINNLQATHVDVYYLASLGYPYEPFNFDVYEFAGWTDGGSWILQSTPTGVPGDLPKEVITGGRSGFYMTSESEQMNIFTQYWDVSRTDPIAAAMTTEWYSKFAVFDSWAWVHLVQLAFAITHLASLLVLVAVSYRNVLTGKLWIGDAFVAVSSNLHFRAVIVLFSWRINGFWSILEFCIYDANQLSKSTRMTIDESIMLADLLTLYFGACAILGTLFRERIDPLLALCSFFIGFQNRSAILQSLLPSLTDRVITFSYEFFEKGSLERVGGPDVISSMEVWAAHEVTSLPAFVIAAILYPIFCTLVFVLVYIVCRKVFRYFYPDPLRVEKASDATGKSNNHDANARETKKSVLTLFEIATGAKLANKFGLLADYDNCMFIKGMKFATPDGIYSSGFVIVNKKYLVQANELWTVLTMKMLRVRFTNVYMYEVNGSTVEQTARLVYPSTFSFAELIYLNTSILS